MFKNYPEAIINKTQ